MRLLIFYSSSSSGPCEVKNVDETQNRKIKTHSSSFSSLSPPPFLLIHFQSIHGNQGVVTVARFNSGEGASNVIPDSVKLAGTVRALTSEDFEILRKRVDEVVSNVAKTHRCEAAVEWEAQPYGPTSNDAGAELALSRVVARLGGQNNDKESLVKEKANSDQTRPSSEITYERALEPTMAAEDFGFLASATSRAVFAFLGTGNESKGTGHGLHTSRFLMDDEQLAVGAAVHAAMALDGLERAAAVAERERAAGGSGGGASAAGRDEL